MTERRRIVLASRNPGKVREIRAVLEPLGVEVVALEEIDPAGAIREPREEGPTFADNARAKAIYYAAATHSPALGDDSGLLVDALGGAPGVHSARYAADQCPPAAGREEIDRANNARLLRELAGVPDEKRTARFVCHLALADGSGSLGIPPAGGGPAVLLEAAGAVAGRIAHSPRGHNGFGYDPLFFVPALGRTTAELPPDRKNRISHRGQAVREFARLLREMLAEGNGR